MSSASRHHRDVLTASLLFIGFIGWIAGLVDALPEPGMLGRAAAVFVAAVLASVVGRRTVADLGLGEVAIAAAVTVTIVIGVATEMRDVPVEPVLLVPIALATLGSVLGMWIPGAGGRGGWRILATAAVGFGVTFTAVGLAMLIEADAAATVVIAGALVGGVVSTLLLQHARAREAAIGQALVYGTSLGAQGASFETLLGGLVLGLLAGALGGWLGRVLRAHRAERRELPTARVEERTR